MSTKNRTGFRNIKNKLFIYLGFIIFFIALSVMQNHSFAQNLILNGSFDTIDSVKYLKVFEKPSHWQYIGSVDYFQSINKNGYLSRLGIPRNKMGYREPIDGAYLGIYIDPTIQLNDDFYSEYVYTNLSQKLQKNATYYLEFYVALSDKHNVITNALGAYFSDKIIDYELQEIYPNKKNPFHSHISLSEKLTYPMPWTKISGIYTAKGDELYLYFGGFFSNDSLHDKSYVKRVNEMKHLSYMYIDKIYLTKLQKGMIDFSNIKRSQTVELSNICFHFDSSELLPHSFYEIGLLLEYLNDNTKARIKLLGHTDNIGTNEHNKELSENRAKAVADYLKANGIHEQRIQYFGYGSTKPVASNSTEDGREKNRRVEFQVY